MTKIKFPKFKGDDVKGWVYKCKQFFKIDGIKEDRKVELASMHLYDQALVWGNRPFKLTQKELEERRAKNQCFYYDQRYFPGHKCSGQLHSLKVVSKSYDELGMEGDDETFKDYVEEVITMDFNPKIYLNALSGLNSFQTMRVKGMFGRHTLHILVDYNSTHNFMDLKTAKSLGCKLESTISLQVSVANGQNMMSCYESELAYNQLKKAVMEEPVLALPNFNQEFVVETNTSGTRIGAVLCQNGQPVAYLRKTLATKHQSLSTYEKEFLVVVAALEKWKGYLLDRHFKIRTYHFSLKYLLNQKMSTSFQLKWIPKILGYDYEILYKKGNENVVADALSRVNQSGEFLKMAVSSMESDVWEKVMFGCRWPLTYGLELAITKFLNFTEYLSTLGAKISKAVEKGMQDGLSARITHGAKGRVLTDVAAYNPSAKANYLSTLQRLQRVNFSLVIELKSNKDASIDTIMNLLCLEDSLANKLGLTESQPHVDQLMVPINHFPDQCVIGASALSLSLDVSSMEGTSNVIPTTVDTTTALSVTFAFASLIPPISTDDYEIVHVEGEKSVGSDADPFPNIDDAELNTS
nr:putative mitochondrial protein [Tanacetum cinerariifolium]